MQTADGFFSLSRAFRLYLQVEGLQPRTIKAYTREVGAFGRELGDTRLNAVTTADLREYFNAMGTTRAPKTVREAQLALRRFFRFIRAEGEIDSDPMVGMKLMNFRVLPQPTYTEAEVKKLLLVCDTTSLEGVRDAALITVLFDTGVREGELVSMQVPDFERRRVDVLGKTGHRRVPLGMAALQAVERYARRWRLDSGPLWWGKQGALTESGALQTVRRLCKRAGVVHKGVHAFRRTAAAQMKRLGMNDSDILEVMGWRDVTMLRRYTAEVAEELAFAAHNRFSPGDNLKVRLH